MEEMENIERTNAELLAEIQELRDRLAISEETLRSIQQGEVDALVISTPQGPRIFTLQTADQSYRLLVEEMEQGAVILSTEGLIVYCNQSFAGLLQQPLDQLIGSYFQRFLSPQDACLFEARVKQVEKGRRHAMELFLMAPAAQIPAYLSISLLKIDQAVMICVVITDLTAQKRHQETLASERLARLILEQAGEAILVCDHTGTIIRFSQVASQIWGKNLFWQPLEALGLLALVPSQVAAPIKPEETIDYSHIEGVPQRKVPFTIAAVLQGASIQDLEVEAESQNGKVLNLMLNARPLRDTDNHFQGAVVVLTDITRRKQTEIALIESQSKLQQQLAEIEAIYQSAPIGLNVLDTNLCFVRINQRLADLNGMSIEAHIGHTMRDLFPEMANQAEPLLYSVLATGEPVFDVEISSEIPTPPPEQRTWLASYFPLKQGDRIIGINTVCKDITEHKLLEAERQTVEEFLRQSKEELEARVAERTATLNQTIIELQNAEEYILASLREKEVLLQEIHHRVKNNLGIVSSLLQMQIRRTQDPQTTIILQDSQNRIASIAMVHEKLYRSKDLSKIDCAQYIQDLTVYLFDSYNISSDQITLTVHVENGQLDTETVIPCGLIINELVSNALKHAFPNNQQGKIRVELAPVIESVGATSQPLFTLTIQDNGIGLPQDLDIKQTKTLGLTLVQGLVKQIGGTIEINRQQGTEFKITFIKPTL
jgi:PAS domain S-box-containing protein